MGWCRLTIQSPGRAGLTNAGTRRPRCRSCCANQRGIGLRASCSWRAAGRWLPTWCAWSQPLRRPRRPCTIHSRFWASPRRLPRRRFAGSIASSVCNCALYSVIALTYSHPDKVGDVNESAKEEIEGHFVELTKAYKAYVCSRGVLTQPDRRDDAAQL